MSSASFSPARSLEKPVERLTGVSGKSGQEKACRQSFASSSVPSTEPGSDLRTTWPGSGASLTGGGAVGRKPDREGPRPQQQRLFGFPRFPVQLAEVGPPRRNSASARCSARGGASRGRRAHGGPYARAQNLRKSRAGSGAFRFHVGPGDAGGEGPRPGPRALGPGPRRPPRKSCRVGKLPRGFTDNAKSPRSSCRVRARVGLRIKLNTSLYGMVAMLTIPEPLLRKYFELKF